MGFPGIHRYIFGGFSKLLQWSIPSGSPRYIDRRSMAHPSVAALHSTQQSLHSSPELCWGHHAEVAPLRTYPTRSSKSSSSEASDIFDTFSRARSLSSDNQEAACQPLGVRTHVSGWLPPALYNAARSDPQAFFHGLPWIYHRMFCGVSQMPATLHEAFADSKLLPRDLSGLPWRGCLTGDLSHRDPCHLIPRNLRPLDPESRLDTSDQNQWLRICHPPDFLELRILGHAASNQTISQRSVAQPLGV
ncbi:hypothetical protein FPQ18DRAFT_315245 [Pyronema domesticum]|nr:hypothetical protein FPQ18DRAFT_315245 [Pyronema domesticum]